MNWAYHSGRKMYIPKLTNNKEIKSCIKALCCSINTKGLMSINKFKLFPENSFHIISVGIFEKFDHRFIPHKDWKEFEISHFINTAYVDSIEAKVKSNGSIYFRYARSENRTLESFPERMNPFYLDSDEIDWDEFAEQLKMWCIEIL